jgi:hypothetical protein
MRVEGDCLCKISVHPWMDECACMLPKNNKHIFALSWQVILFLQLEWRAVHSLSISLFVHT